jgi:hypothetical protein
MGYWGGGGGGEGKGGMGWEVEIGNRPFSIAHLGNTTTPHSLPPVTTPVLPRSSFVFALLQHAAVDLAPPPAAASRRPLQGPPQASFAAAHLQIGT